MSDTENTLDILFEHLEKILSTESIVGKPIEIGEVTLVPIIEIGFGAAVGGGTGRENHGSNGDVTGAGAGMKISPNTFLVIRNKEVTVLSLKNREMLDKIFEVVPEMIHKGFKEYKRKKENK